MGREPPGSSGITVGSQGLVRLAAGAVLPGGLCSERDSKAMCAWLYATPARRFGSWQRLAARVTRQTISTATAWNFCGVIVIYKESSSALKVGLLVFLELWLGTCPLSCGSG